MSFSSLSFGILLILRAVLTQSAPYIYQDAIDEDEEALIDRVASLAAQAQSQERYKLQKPNTDFSPDLDLAQLSYLAGFGLDDLSKQSFQNLPRQFGYRPDDIRFFLDANQFPNYIGDPQQPQQNKPTNSIESSDIGDAQRQSKAVDDWTQSQYHIMKKNNPEDYSDMARSNYPAEPSNIMSNAHSADHPDFRVHEFPEQRSPYPYTDIYYIALIAGCSAAAVVGVVAAGICWYRIHERVKAAADVDYPAYGVTGPSKDVSPCGGDRKLAQSAHMYHYQHQKQQMAVLQKTSLQGDRQGSAESDVESDDDNEEGDYTVYECPGLAPAGDMEVKNPLFQDEPTPASPQPVKFSDDVETGNDK